MNHELHHSNGEQPDAVPAIITVAMGYAATDSIAEHIADVYHRHGNAFAAYLTLEGVDPYGETVETDFLNALEGIHRDRTTLIEATIESFGWERDLNRIAHNDPTLGSILMIDRDAVWELIHEHFDVVEIGSTCYVFEARDR